MQSAYISILKPVCVGDELTTILRNNTSTSGTVLGVASVRFAVVLFQKTLKGIDVSVCYTPGQSKSYPIRDKADHDRLRSGRCPLAHPGIFERLQAAAVKFCAYLNTVKSEAWFEEAFKEIESRVEVGAFLYESRRLCGNAQCFGCDKKELKSKVSDGGILSWVCELCGLVQGEDAFGGVSQAPREFEEQKEKAAQDTKYHRMKHGKNSGYKHTETLLRTRSADKKGRTSASLLREGCAVISAVLAKRVENDLALLSNAVPVAAFLSKAASASHSVPEEIVEAAIKCIQRPWVEYGQLTRISVQIFDIFLDAANFFYRLRVKNSVAKDAYGDSKVYSTALYSAVYAIRKYDARVNETGGRSACSMHALYDFCLDKSYTFELRKPVKRLRLVQETQTWAERWDRKPHPIHIPSHRSFCVAYEKFLLKAGVKSPDTDRAYRIHHMILRVLNELKWVVFDSPIQDIASVKDAQCYIYRMRARARVLQYWAGIKMLLDSHGRNTKEGAAARKLLDDFDGREDILVACSVVYNAFRASSHGTMQHPWPQKVIDVMEATRVDESKMSIDGVRELLVFGQPGPYTEDEKEIASHASEMLQEYDAYKAYARAVKTWKRPLTDRDICFQFQIRWFCVLFHISEKRIVDCCKYLPPLSLDAVDATRNPEAVLQITPGFVRKVENRAFALGVPGVSRGNNSGVALVVPVTSKYRKRKASWDVKKEEETAL